MRGARQHLNLPGSVGLVCDFVEKGSPAEAAGLKQYDVLHKLDDQILVNAQQLAVLIRARKGGGEVKLSIVRGGKPGRSTRSSWRRTSGRCRSRSSGRSTRTTRTSVSVAQPPDVAFRDVFEHANRSVDVRKSDDRTVVAFSDGEHTLTVTRQGGEAHLTAKDKRASRLRRAHRHQGRACEGPRRDRQLKQLESVRVQGETR